MSFDEIVQQADIIFVGTVTSQESRYAGTHNMILTDIFFRVEKIIHEKADVTQTGDFVKLTFAGGQIGGRRVWVSDVPSFEFGAQYLLFSRANGNTYVSPLIGGSQGLFHVLKDQSDETGYPLSYGDKRTLTAFDNGYPRFGPRVRSIRGGIVENELSSGQPDLSYDVAPEPVTHDSRMLRGSTASPGDIRRGTLRATVVRFPQTVEKPMNLEELIGEIRKRIR